MAYQQQEWKHKGHSCCTPFSSCLLAWFCPCILYGKTRHRVKNNGNLDGYSACNSSCMAFCGLSCLGVPFVLPMIRRGDMRAKYHLQGNGCKDCLCACCCGPCDLVQQDKEATFREANTAPVSEQPKPQGQMQYGQSVPGQYAPQTNPYPQHGGGYPPQNNQYPQQGY